MCRHLAYLGPPVPLATLVLDPPHSLVRQSYAPREMVVGTVNADGFGVGWYTPDLRPEPARYRRAQPIWTDASFASLAGVVASGCVLAAVRNATPGFPVEESGAAPFTSGRWLFSLNGSAADWPRAAATLRETLPAGAVVESPSDAALMWAVLRSWLDGGEPLEVAVVRLLDRVVSLGGGLLNFLATDGELVVATAWGNTLYLCDGGTAEGVRVASEPLDDDPRWQRVADRSFVVVSRDGIAVTDLPLVTAGSSR